MTQRFDIEQADPVPWVRERDIDLLLAESLHSHMEFVSWFLRQVPQMAESADSVTGCLAVVNFNRPDAPGHATGETDVLARVSFADRPDVLLSIEDKVLASPQLDQGRRHRDYLASQPYVATAAVLVAPAAWIEAHPDEVSAYDLAIRLEDVAAWHDQHADTAVKWRGRVIRQAVRQRAVMAPAPDLDAWCADFDASIRPHGLRLAPQFRQRSAAPGQAVSGRFIWCAEETLGDLSDLSAVLFFKHASAKYPGRVSIDIEVEPDDGRGEVLMEQARAAELACRRTKAYVIVESYPPDAEHFNMAEPVAAQGPAVEALAAAAKQLQDWWASLVASRPFT